MDEVPLKKWFAKSRIHPSMHFSKIISCELKNLSRIQAKSRMHSRDFPWTQIRKKEEETGPTLSRGILAIYILYDILAEGDICFTIHYLD
jgi:hypothetical protein